jgi:hypothetical protein
LLLLLAPRASAVISISAGPGGNGIIINTLLGADRFYNNGWLGQNAVVANVEAGAVWNGHETLTQVNTYIADPTITGTQLGQFDYHATAVGMTIAGQGQFFYYQAGIAPLTQLWSASIATSFNADGSFDITRQSFLYAYKESIVTGRDVTYDLGGGVLITVHRTADVVNSSWGFTDPAGQEFETHAIDALVFANHTTFTVSAGNGGPGGNTVGGPATGFNKIAVGSLAADTTDNPYTAPSTFSSRGPNDFYNPKTGITTHGVRPVVDIAAPGEELALAYYGGTTGSNTGGVDQSNGANNFYLINASGTSFASPTVAGGAALLADYAHFNYGPHGYDARVIKAVLLNSADKTAGWNNGQFLRGKAIVTFQGLDYATGAGRMNLNRAYDQFTAGTADNPTPSASFTGGVVQPVGWLMGHVNRGAPVDYDIAHQFTAGESLTATLTWFVHATLDDSAGPDLATAGDTRFDILYLEVWRILNGIPTTEVATSVADYNNVQHLSFPVPDDGEYLLRIRWAGQLYDLTNPDPTVIPGEDYALAWSNLVPVPEPTSLTLFLIVALPLLRRPKRPPPAAKHLY